MAMPSTQWFGSGFGQRGSTSNRGAITPALVCASTTRSSLRSATVNEVSAAANAAPATRLRRAVIVPLPSG